VGTLAVVQNSVPLPGHSEGSPKGPKPVLDDDETVLMNDGLTPQ